MTSLSKVLPRNQLVERFGSELILAEFGKPEIKKILEMKPQSLHGIAGSVWNRIVARNWHEVDPKMFSRRFDKKDPSLYRHISDKLGIEVIRDIYYAKAWRNARKERNVIAEVLVAWVYQNDLNLADVTFVDRSAPIPKADRKSALQTHKGLGLLPVLLQNMQTVAEEIGCKQLTLIAGTQDEMKLFQHHGFDVEDSDLGRFGVETWGRNYDGSQCKTLMTSLLCARTASFHGSALGGGHAESRTVGQWPLSVRRVD